MENHETDFWIPPVDYSELDFRTLVFVYLAQNPGSTQAELAQKLGVTPVILSRALNNPNAKIRPEWMPVIEQMINDIDAKSYGIKWDRIVLAQKELQKQNRQRTVIPVLQKYINQIDAGYKINRAGSRLYFCSFTNEKTGKRWAFVEFIEDQAKWRYAAREGTRYNYRVSVICYDFDDFNFIIDHIESHMLSQFYSIFFLDESGELMEWKAGNKAED